MLTGSDSFSYYSKTNLTIWMTMAFQAGLLNMGGFMACHEFVSHVTGFATLFGREVSEFRFDHAAGMLLVPVFFFLGAMLSGQLVDLRLRQRLKPRYYVTFGGIFFLILFVLVGGTLGYFGQFGETTYNPRFYLLLAVLCLVCGIQNGTVTSVSRSIVRTTHLTGVTTDLGIGIIRVLNGDKIEGGIADEIKANVMRAGIILFFIVGSVVAAFFFRDYGYLGFILPATTSGALLLAALYFQMRS